MDLFFNGLPIDCSGKDFAKAAVCSKLAENPEGLVVVEPDQYLFSLFGAVD